MKKFSLVIPVYKQGKTIKRDIELILETLSKYSVPFEIIVVIDGALDNSEKEVEKIKDERVMVVGYKTNHGKGYAVRYGFANASGDVIGFMDAGGDLSPNALPMMIEKFIWEEADIVIGSKRHKESKVAYPWGRTIISWVYYSIIRLMFGLSISDSQVGMKLFRRKVLEDVLPRLLVKNFAFDIEMLAVAYHLGYTKIYEAPVEIDLFSSVSSIRLKKMIGVIFNMLIDTLSVFYRLRIIHYYDDASKRKWRYDPELNFRINIG